MSSSEMKSKPRSEISVTKIHVELKLDLNQVFFVKGGDGSLVPPPPLRDSSCTTSTLYRTTTTREREVFCVSRKPTILVLLYPRFYRRDEEPVPPSLPASWSLDKPIFVEFP